MIDYILTGWLDWLRLGISALAALVILIALGRCAARLTEWINRP